MAEGNGAGKSRQDSRRSGLIAFSVDEFLDLEIPPRQFLLAPILRQQDLAMVYGPAGTGKTFFAMSLAGAIASGQGFLRWTVSDPRRVVYVDGELPGEDLQKKLRALKKVFSGKGFGENFVVCPHQFQEFTPSIDDPEGQHRIEQHLDGASLLVLDNVSTLCRQSVENDSQAWQPMQDWLLKLRRQGLAVVLLHHAGKGGQQRGTSKRADVLDTVIELRRPAGYRQQDGARFEVHFEKARGSYGQDVEPLEAALSTDSAGNPAWIFKAVQANQPPIRERILELAESGMSGAAIARELGCAQSHVSRTLKSLDR